MPPPRVFLFDRFDSYSFSVSGAGAAWVPGASGSSVSSPSAGASSWSVRARAMTLSLSSLKRMTMTPWVDRPAIRMASTGVRMRMPLWVTNSRSSLPSTTLMPMTGPVFSVTM